MGHTTKTLARVLAVLTILLSGISFLTSFGVASASADPAKPTSITITNVSQNEEATSVTVTGKITADDGPVSAAQVSAKVDSAPVGSSATGADGSFTISFNAPSTGTHNLEVSWQGDTTYASASNKVTFKVEPKKKTVATLSLTVEPPVANPGLPISINGTLVSATGEPISSAKISLALSWGSDTGFTITDDSGVFATSLTLPQDSQFPGSVTVTASFDGDNVFDAAQTDSSISVEAAPVQTENPEVTTSATASTQPTVHPTHESSPTPSIAPVTPLKDNPHLMTALVISAAVSLTAIVVLIVLGVISNIKHRLSTDERRGFGSDFGKMEH